MAHRVVNEFLSIDRQLSTRTGGGLGVSAYSDCARIELTVWKPWYVGRVSWKSVSLNPAQAVRLAHILLVPPRWQRVRVQDGSKPFRVVWQVLAVKHGNGVHSGEIGVSLRNHGGTVVEIGVLEMTGNYEKTRSRATDCWCPSWSVTMTTGQVKVLAGLLYLWAGARMVGTRRVLRKSVERIMYLREPKPSDAL